VSGPLDGVKVVDLTAMLAGPYATMLLADLGADVVKIESEHGDGTRGVGPFRKGDGPTGLSGYFQSVNRGKRSVVIDLKSPAGRDHLLELVRVADVVAENFSAGVMDRLGLSYETLQQENPRLVYAAIQAMGGFLSITGTLEGTPIKSGPGIGDLFPAALLALGVVSAVLHAHRTGEGQFVDVAMYDAVLSLCERMVYQHSYTGAVPVPLGNGHPLLCPFDIFPTKDGWIAIAAPHDRHWQIIAETIGRPDMATDARFLHNIDRSRHAAEVRAVLETWLAGRTTRETVDALGGRVPVGPVNDVAAIFTDPHVAARSMLLTVPQPGSDTPVTIAGQPLKFTRTPGHISQRAPLLGEHDLNAILAEWTRPEH
jgi:crotonobetainyl-CoA:carnitine CoA-transferase CaiB-like acyl-CoA transferase